jgi:hypothetical protein
MYKANTKVVWCYLLSEITNRLEAVWVMTMQKTFALLKDEYWQFTVVLQTRLAMATAKPHITLARQSTPHASLSTTPCAHCPNPACFFSL